VDNVSCFWNFTAFGPEVRGSGFFSAKIFFTAKVCHSAKEIPLDMHTFYQCKTVNNVEKEVPTINSDFRRSQIHPMNGFSTGKKA
jgi:hypothetical protein